jgi:hypothetical protein
MKTSLLSQSIPKVIINVVGLTMYFKHYLFLDNIIQMINVEIECYKKIEARSEYLVSYR